MKILFIDKTSSPYQFSSQLVQDLFFKEVLIEKLSENII